MGKRLTQTEGREGEGETSIAGRKTLFKSRVGGGKRKTEDKQLISCDKSDQRNLGFPRESVDGCIERVRGSGHRPIACLPGAPVSHTFDD